MFTVYIVAAIMAFFMILVAIIVFAILPKQKATIDDSKTDTDTKAQS